MRHRLLASPLCDAPRFDVAEVERGRGISVLVSVRNWIPAFAGMTMGQGTNCSDQRRPDARQQHYVIPAKAGIQFSSPQRPLTPTSAAHP